MCSDGNDEEKTGIEQSDVMDEIEDLINDIDMDRIDMDDDSDPVSAMDDFLDTLHGMWRDVMEDGTIPLSKDDYIDITFDQIIGLDRVIERVQNEIIPFFKAVLELESSVPRVAGLMISGPRHTGKSHIALAIIRELALHHDVTVFRVQLSDGSTDDIDTGTLDEVFKQLQEKETGPAILLLENIPGKSSFNAETLMMKSGVLDDLADDLMEMVEQVPGPLLMIGTTTDLKDLPAGLFDLSLFPLNIRTRYPDIMATWRRIMEDAGLEPITTGLDRSSKLTVRQVKHLLKFAMIHARIDGRSTLQEGDIRYARSLLKAKEQVFDVPVEVPKVDLNSFVGHKAVKVVREQLLLPIRYSDLAQHYGIPPAKGVFITGPMGCGKTHLARCIAGELKWSLVHLNVGSFGSEYLHAHERQLHMMVNDWLGRQEPMVVLMDEVDNLVPLEASKEDWAARTGNMVLLEIERLLHRKGEPLLVVAATSRPEDVNPALIRAGRLDLRIDLGFPDEQEREALFRLYLGEIGKDLDISAAVQQPYTPAEIERVSKRTLWQAFVRATKTGIQSPPSEVDLQQAMRQVPPQDKVLHNRGSVSR